VMIMLPTSRLMEVWREDVRNWVTPAWHVVNDVIQRMRRTDVTPARTTGRKMDAAAVAVVAVASSSMMGRSMN